MKNENRTRSILCFCFSAFFFFLPIHSSIHISSYHMPIHNGQFETEHEFLVDGNKDESLIVDRNGTHTRSATDELTMNVVVHFYRLFFVGILITKHFKFAENNSSSPFDKRPKRKWALMIANYKRLCEIEQGQGFDLLFSPACNGIYLAIMVLLNDR